LLRSEEDRTRKQVGMGCNQSKKEDIKTAAREHSGFPHLPAHEVPALTRRPTGANAHTSNIDAEHNGHDEGISYTERREENHEDLLKKIVLQASQDLIDIGSLPISPEIRAASRTEEMSRSYRLETIMNKSTEWQLLPKDLSTLQFFSTPTPSILTSAPGINPKDILSPSSFEGKLPPSFWRRFESLGKELDNALENGMVVESCGDILVHFGSVDNLAALPASKPKTNKQPTPPPPTHGQPSTSLF